MIIAIAVTSFINSNANSKTDIRAKASVQTGVVYEAIVNSIDQGAGTLTVESVTPKNGGLALIGTWTVLVPSNIPLDEFSGGMNVLITVDAQKFNIKTHIIEAKNVSAK